MMAIKQSSQVLCVTTGWRIPHGQRKSRKFEKYRKKNVSLN